MSRVIYEKRHGEKGWTLLKTHGVFSYILLGEYTVIYHVHNHSIRIDVAYLRDCLPWHPILKDAALWSIKDALF